VRTAVKSDPCIGSLVVRPCCAGRVVVLLRPGDVQCEQQMILHEFGYKTKAPESGAFMVGDTGIEPVTPTVSTFSARR
jgi:hypothetical protein